MRRLHLVASGRQSRSIVAVNMSRSGTPALDFPAVLGPGGEEASVVDSDLFVDLPVQQRVHLQDHVLDSGGVGGEVGRFVGVVLKIEQLEVVAVGQLLEGLGAVMLDRREVPAELVAPVEDATDRAALGEVEPRRLIRLLARRLRRGYRAEKSASSNVNML